MKRRKVCVMYFYVLILKFFLISVQFQSKFMNLLDFRNNFVSKNCFKKTYIFYCGFQRHHDTKFTSPSTHSQYSSSYNSRPANSNLTSRPSIRAGSYDSHYSGGESASSKPFGKVTVSYSMSSSYGKSANSGSSGYTSRSSGGGMSSSYHQEYSSGGRNGTNSTGFSSDYKRDTM